MGVRGQVGTFHHVGPGDQTQAIRLGTWLVYLADLRTTDFKGLVPVSMEPRQA